ncbi:hypothetical protein [Flavobacterium sp.]|jgi:hypothetical protein|uniref:hypothetical protein n=1 Tax=Flavobacterium sp. TaxID=239 RepID=UPI0037BF3FC6
MEKNIEIKYKPNIENLMKVSKYLLVNLPFVKYFPLAFIILILMTKLTTLVNTATIEEKYDLGDFFALFVIISLWIIIFFRKLSTMKKNILSNKKILNYKPLHSTQNPIFRKAKLLKLRIFGMKHIKLRKQKNGF